MLAIGWCDNAYRQFSTSGTCLVKCERISGLHVLAWVVAALQLH